MRETIVGTLVCHRYTRHHRRGSILGRMLLDQLQPLPHAEIWCIDSATEKRASGSSVFFKMRSGKLPSCLDRKWEGHRVVVRANVVRWKNGLGGYISHVVLDDEPSTEVSLATD